MSVIRHAVFLLGDQIYEIFAQGLYICCADVAQPPHIFRYAATEDMMPNTPLPVKYSWHMASAMITFYKYQTRLSRALIEAMVALHPLAPRSGPEAAKPGPKAAPADTTGADTAPPVAQQAVPAAPAAPATPAPAPAPVPVRLRRGAPGPALHRGPMGRRLPADAALQRAQGGYAALSMFMSAGVTYISAKGGTETLLKGSKNGNACNKHRRNPQSVCWGWRRDCELDDRPGRSTLASWADRRTRGEN